MNESVVVVVVTEVGFENVDDLLMIQNLHYQIIRLKKNLSSPKILIQAMYLRVSLRAVTQVTVEIDSGVTVETLM